MNFKSFAALRPKMYNYLANDEFVNKKAKRRRCVINLEIKFGGYKKRQENNKMVLRSKTRGKLYNVFREHVNKIALSANDNSRIQTLEAVISYPYGTGPGIVCREESMRHPTLTNRM